MPHVVLPEEAVGGALPIAAQLNPIMGLDSGAGGGGGGREALLSSEGATDISVSFGVGLVQMVHSTTESGLSRPHSEHFFVPLGADGGAIPAASQLKP